MIPSSLIKKPQSFIEIQGASISFNLDVSTDTRTINNENTFICLYGENFDAHSMLDKIVSHESIKVIIAEKKRTLPEIIEQVSENHHVSFILVEDIFVYIRELARECVLEWKDKGKTLIGLTGSAGKTSSKEALFHILNTVFPNKVLATKGNLNNHIGVPLTLFRLEKNIDIAIVEMGTNAPGEIRILAETAVPDAGLITNVGAAHLEKLKNLEGVFQEKSSLYQVVNELTEGTGVFILPSDDIYLNRLKDFPGVITFGEEGHYQFQFDGDSAKLEKGNANWTFSNQISEHHLLKNLAQVFILVRTLFPEKEKELFAAALTFHPQQKNRGELIERDGRKIYLDAYNANPLSMKVAIDTFERLLEKDKSSKTNSLIILGDMRELGVEAIRFHEELGEYLLQKNFPNVFFVGEYGKAVIRRLESARLFNTTDELAAFLKEQKDLNYSHIFLKGSRALALEKLALVF